MTTVAIMQPTFLPWLGYFAMINEVDIFVLLDDVQFSRQSFQQRNRIKTAQGPLTISIPCKRGKSLIQNVEVVPPPQIIYKKLANTIAQSYAKAPYLFELMPILRRVLDRNHTKLCDLNCELIKEITILLNINTKLIMASDLKIEAVDKTVRPEKICNNLNADLYLSAQGSYSYLKNSNPFETSSIELRFFSFEHPVYPQLYGKFESYLSVIDAIFNVGSSETLKLMCSGVRPSLDITEMSSSSC